VIIGLLSWRELARPLTVVVLVSLKYFIHAIPGSSQASRPSWSGQAARLGPTIAIGTTTRTQSHSNCEFSYFLLLNACILSLVTLTSLPSLHQKPIDPVLILKPKLKIATIQPARGEIHLHRHTTFPKFLNHIISNISVRWSPSLNSLHPTGFGYIY